MSVAILLTGGRVRLLGILQEGAPPLVVLLIASALRDGHPSSVHDVVGGSALGLLPRGVLNGRGGHGRGVRGALASVEMVTLEVAEHFNYTSHGYDCLPGSLPENLYLQSLK